MISLDKRRRRSARFCWLRSYALGLVGVLAPCGLFSAAASYLWVQRVERSAAQTEARLAMQIDINRRHVRQREVDQRQYAAVVHQLTAANAALSKVEKSNVEILRFLAQPVPAGVRRVLDHAEARGVAPGAVVPGRSAGSGQARDRAGTDPAPR